MNQNPGIPPHLQQPQPPIPEQPFNFQSTPDNGILDVKAPSNAPTSETTRVVHKCCHVIDLGEAAASYREGKHSHIYCDVCLEKFPVTEFFWEGTSEQLFYAGA